MKSGGISGELRRDPGGFAGMFNIIRSLLFSGSFCVFNQHVKQEAGSREAVADSNHGDSNRGDEAAKRTVPHSTMRFLTTQHCT